MQPELPPRRGAHVTACGTLQPVFVRKVELCRRFVEEVLERVDGFEDVYRTDLNEVENRWRDGFIPFTDGGFDGVGYATLSYAHSSGAAPSVIQPYLDAELKQIEQAWDEKHPERPVSWIYADEEPHPTSSREVWREAFCDFENESMSEGGTYFYKVRVLFHGDQHRSESGEPEALFCVGINTDFEYGRDHIPWLSCYGKDPNCTKWLWERTVKVRDLSGRRVDSFIRQAIKALEAA